MAGPLTPDLCVIGAGSAGLSVAAGAVQMGASVVLVEAGRMGGDCLNYGCVPSKALLAAGKAAATARKAERFGVRFDPPRIDFAAVNAHVHGVIAAIAPHDSVERFEGLGVTVIQARARFTGPGTAEAGGTVIQPRRFVIATGSTPAVPPIPGLEAVPYLTNETLFDLTRLPDHLIIIGGGPIGLEMAQAHRMLGSRVTVLEAARIMPRDEPALVDVLRQRLRADGIDLREGCAVRGVRPDGDGVAVDIEADRGVETIKGSVLLLATGRRPNIDQLGLEAAGIESTRAGITVDRRLRTSNGRAFAMGDAAGGPQFTHIAGYHAGIVIKNALFRWPAKVDYSALPWVTYTDPELAHVGLTAAEAEQRHGDRVRTLSWPLAENDRAQAERETEGRVIARLAPNGLILGADILAPHAGEMIGIWALAISRRQKIGAIANTVLPYPTFGEASKRAAGSYYTPKLFSDRTRAIVRFLARFG